MTFPRSFVTGMFLGVFLTAITAYFVLDLRTSQRKQKAIGLLHHQVALQTETIDSLLKQSRSGWLSQILEVIHQDLRQSPDGKLSATTIDRIANFCFSSKPYPSISGDSLTSRKLSPERGQLLLELSKLPIDTSSMKRILQMAVFDYADLRGSDLRGAYLPHARLGHADFRNADMEGAYMEGANLAFADCWGARMNKVNLNQADLRRADLSWANLNHAMLQSAQIQEADLISAQIRNADFTKADLQWADCTGAFLNASNFTETNLFRTTFKRAQLPDCMFQSANLLYTNLGEANLHGADLTTAKIQDALVAEEDWIDQLMQREVKGAKRVQDSFHLVPQVVFQIPMYQVKKRPVL